MSIEIEVHIGYFISFVRRYTIHQLQLNVLFYHGDVLSGAGTEICFLLSISDPSCPNKQFSIV